MKYKSICGFVCIGLLSLISACGEVKSNDTSAIISESMTITNTSNVTSIPHSYNDETILKKDIGNDVSKVSGLSKDAIQSMSEKRGTLTLEDLQKYVGSISMDPQTGSFYESFLFDYDGIPMGLRIIASDCSIASKPYDNILDSIILFRQDFLELSTEEDELSYEGTCGDIRHGEITHIVNGCISSKDYLDISLPSGYSLSDYKYWIGTHGGFYVIKDGAESRQTFENTGYSAESSSLGGVEIATVSEPENNSEVIKSFDDIHTDGLTIISGLYEFYRPEVKWYFAYTQKENSQITFCFYLNPDYFSEDQFIEMVKSIKIKNDAIY